MSEAPLATSPLAPLAAELAEAERALRPASRKEAAAVLGRLAVHFWQPDRPEGHWKLISEDYLDELCQYPPDILEAGRKEALRRFTFMPKISEMIEILAPMRHERYVKRDETRHAIEASRTPKPPNQPPPTDEDKAEVAAAVAKMAGRVARKMTAPAAKRERMTKAQAEAQLVRDKARVAREMEAAGMAPPSGS